MNCWRVFEFENDLILCVGITTGPTLFYMIRLYTPTIRLCTPRVKLFFDFCLVIEVKNHKKANRYQHLFISLKNWQKINDILIFQAKNWEWWRKKIWILNKNNEYLTNFLWTYSDFNNFVVSNTSSFIYYAWKSSKYGFEFWGQNRIFEGI